MPMPKEPTNRPSKQRRFTPAERKTIRRALARGVKQADLAREYEVSRTAIWLIHRKMLAEQGDPQALAAYHSILAKANRPKLTENDWKKLAGILRTSVPKDHGISPSKSEAGFPWDVPSVTALAGKVLDRTPPFTRVVSLLNHVFPERTLLPKPRPPKRITLKSIPAEQRGNKIYVDYVTSETYWNIQQQEYKAALEYHKRDLAARKNAPMPALPLPPRSKGIKAPPPPVKPKVSARKKAAKKPKR